MTLEGLIIARVTSVAGKVVAKRPPSGHNVAMTTTRNSDIERQLALTDEIIDNLADAGFMPMDYAALDDEELQMTPRDAGIIDYYAAKGWDGGWRLEPTDATAWATLARYSEDGIQIMSIDRNGTIHAEARFSFNPIGVAWLAATVNAEETR